MATECLWYNGEASYYKLLDFDPDGLSDKEIIEKATAQIKNSYMMTRKDAEKALDTLYLIDVGNLRKIGEEIKSLPERIAKMMEGKSEDAIAEIFDKVRKIEAKRHQTHQILDRMDEYRSYVKSCIEDNNFDLTTMEDWHTWLEEEKIRCRDCGILNTEQRGEIKHCTDCKCEDKIAPNNQANWASKNRDKPAFKGSELLR